MVPLGASCENHTLLLSKKWAGPKGMDNLFPLKCLSHFDPLLNQKTEKKTQLKFTSNST